MTPTTQIINELTTIFNEMDARVLEKSKEWAKGRVQAIREWRAANPTAHREMGAAKYYGILHAIAGGKTWYNVFYGRNEDMINEFVTKNCEAIAQRRNATIARKLEKAGITKVMDSKLERTTDGFNGFFQIETDKGIKNVVIETIYAGGYNIQCLHLRVLTKIR